MGLKVPVFKHQKLENTNNPTIMLQNPAVVKTPSSLSSSVVKVFNIYNMKSTLALLKILVSHTNVRKIISMTLTM